MRRFVVVLVVLAGCSSGQDTGVSTASTVDQMVECQEQWDARVDEWNELDDAGRDAAGDWESFASSRGWQVTFAEHVRLECMLDE